MKFTVSDTADVQKVEMKDAVPVGRIIINKKVNLSKKLPGKICWQAAWTQHLAMLQVL